ncbi:MAG: hypothetical protein M4579_005685 [Chaenotheca gracillima]|nr:MAG: hypothetical protein M4579_005685 [Chaenotheca gracillima]
MYTRRRSNWFELADCGFDAEASIVSMAKRLFFVTNREYEVFMVGCRMRDAEEESLQYDTFFSGVYLECALEPAEKYLPRYGAHSYFVPLRVNLSAAAHEAHANVPEEGAKCVVTVNNETWPGVVVPSPKGIDEWTYNSAIHAFRAALATGLVVGDNSHTVRVRFGPRGQLMKASIKSHPKDPSPVLAHRALSNTNPVLRVYTLLLDEVRRQKLGEDTLQVRSFFTSLPLKHGTSSE